MTMSNSILPYNNQSDLYTLYPILSIHNEREDTVPSPIGILAILGDSRFVVPSSRRTRIQQFRTIPRMEGEFGISSTWNC
jgi:hypothetical protein